MDFYGKLRNIFEFVDVVDGANEEGLNSFELVVMLTCISAN